MSSTPQPGVLALRRFEQHFSTHESSEMSATEREHWGNRACGLACMRTVLDYYDLPVPPQVDMLKRGLELGAYSERGWIHAGLLTLARELGLDGVTGRVSDIEQLSNLAAAGIATIVSSTLHFPTDGQRGGHLVAFAGCSGQPDDRQAHFADPSRWGENNSTVPASRFWASCTGRIIALWGPETPTPVCSGIGLLEVARR